MPRLVMLTKGGQETGFAVAPSDFDKAEAVPEADGKSWAEHGYKLAYYEDTREPYKSPRQAAVDERTARDEKKGD